MAYWSGYCLEGIAPKEKDIQYHNIRKSPFKIYGLHRINNDNYYRLPVQIAEKVSGGVLTHMKSSAGVRVRFSTNSPFVAVRAEIEEFSPAPHVTDLANKGFDLYTVKEGKYKYHNSFCPPLDTENEVCGITYFSDEKTRDILIDFPNGAAVVSLEVGIKKGSVLSEGGDYQNRLPIVFYGSSITQGFAASRPGNSYENFISRWLNVDYINMGFSGSAMGEENLARYLSKIPMSAFVLDYDYNSPDVEHLTNTHLNFYRIVRDNNPYIPIVVVSRPEPPGSKEGSERRKVITDTFKAALENGETNTYFVDGSTFFGKDAISDCTVDGCHPNDLGMYFIARKIGKTISRISINEALYDKD